VALAGTEIFADQNHDDKNKDKQQPGDSCCMFLDRAGTGKMLSRQQMANSINCTKTVPRRDAARKSQAAFFAALKGHPDSGTARRGQNSLHPGIDPWLRGLRRLSNARFLPRQIPDE
jgi:hypothetical protein